jgi:hypothetical protein
MLACTGHVLGPYAEAQISNHSTEVDISMACLLLFVLFQNLISIVLNSTQHVIDKGCGFELEKPSQRNNTFRNGAQVVEVWRNPVRLADIVDRIGCFVEFGHKFWVEWIWFLCLGGDENKGTLSLECLKNCLGL